MMMPHSTGSHSVTEEWRRNETPDARGRETEGQTEAKLEGGGG